MTIRTRLIILTIAGLAMTMAIWGWVQIRALDRLLVDQHGRRLIGLAETVSQFYVQFPTDAGLSALDNALRENLMQDSRLARLDIFSLADGWLDHSAGASRIYFEWPEETLAAARKKFQIHYVKVKTENGPALGLLYPILPERDRNTYVGILSYSRSYSEILAGARQLLLLSAGALILIILVIFVLGYRYLVDKPLQLIVKTIGNIEQGSYSERIPLIRQDEWGRLAGHINSMAAKIDQVMTSNRGLNISLEQRIAEATHKVVQLQTELGQLQKLNALGYLTANLAHDMGTPLHSIAGLARLLLEQNNLSADQRRKLELIVQQTERLNAIISNVRRATRLPEPEFEYLCVSELLAETKALIEPLMTPKGIALAVAPLPPDIPPLWGDRHRIQTALFNLIENAGEALKNRGTISVLVDCQTDGAFLTVTVEDDGPGIPLDVREQIWGPFFSTHSGDGLRGLGLTIVMDIMKVHRGFVQMESEPGKGARVALSFPLHHRQAEAAFK